jgi:hypothetical protein
MQGPIAEARFIELLSKGVGRTFDLMAMLTDYHGGPTATEYILTADIARAFAEEGYEVGVEVKNRTLVNGSTQRRSAPPRSELGSIRTDVAVVSSDVVPQAMVEVKIGVGKSLRPLRADLCKIVGTILRMRAKIAANVRAASVFQIHIQGKKYDTDTSYLQNKMKAIEDSLRAQLVAFGKDWPDFTFRLEPLQGAQVGFTGTSVEIEDENTSVLGKRGHATRYYAIVINSIRQPPPGDGLDALRHGE